MRRLVLAALTATVLAIPTTPALGVGGTNGLLEAGTRLGLDLRTEDYPRTKLEVRIAPTLAGDISIGFENGTIDFEIPAVAHKPVVTNVTLQDGMAVVLGGLVITKETDKKVSHKVPWLSETPVIGALFRSQTEMTLRNLLVFVTPTLVDPEAKGKEVEGYAGDFRIDDAKGKGSVRVIRNFTKYRGSWKWIIKGTWLDGPAAGKTFKATLKGKLKGTRG